MKRKQDKVGINLGGEQRYTWHCSRTFSEYPAAADFAEHHHRSKRTKIRYRHNDTFDVMVGKEI